MRFTKWVSGQYNAICDVCGFKFKNVDLKERWDGLWVCKDDWEVEHPLQRIRPQPMPAKLPFTRPEPPDLEIGGVCSAAGRQGTAGVGEAGCAVLGLILPWT